MIQRRLSECLNEIAEIKKLVIENRETVPEPAIDNKPGSPPSFFGLLPSAMLQAGRELVRRNLSEELALDIIMRLWQAGNPLDKKLPEIRDFIRRELCSLLPKGKPIAVNPDSRTVAMFVGPTGSGKSSAVARVAMDYKSENSGKVAIITADNFRADSSQQIKSYCRIIGCPFGVVYSPEELSLAIKSQPDGLILIDTPGVNLSNSEDINEIMALSRASKPQEIHLVLPAATPAEDGLNLVEALADLGVNRVLITKLDETRAPGGVITTIIKTGNQLSYVSSSREIPGCFGPALPESLVSALMIEEISGEDKPEYEMEAVGIWQ